LPVSYLAACGLRSSPLFAGKLDCSRVMTVKDLNDTIIRREVQDRRPFHQETDVRAVGVLITRRQKNRLQVRWAVADRTVRQKAVVAIGPEPAVKRLQALLAPTLDHCTPAALKCALEQG